MKKLKLLLAFCALLLGWSNAWAYQTPVADGIYYLYNTGCTSGETGFMSTGNDYGFQVVIDKFGFPVKLIDAGDGKFQFQFIHHEGFLSDDGFMYSDGGNTGENPRARTITLQHQGDGIYKLINTSNNKEIELWYDHNVVGDGAGNRKDYLWQFFSKAERDAIVAGYTTSVKLAAATSMGMPASVDTESEFDEYLSTNYIGLDQSSKITNGTFTTAHTTTGWTTTANSNREFNIGWGNKDPKDTPEVYEGAGSLSHTQISVDKAGLYKVSVNATYRCGNSANNNRIGDLGYDGSVAYLQANNSIAKISDWYSGKINGNGPDSPSEANSAYFSQGKYLTEVYVYVGDGKTIDISLHSHAHTWGGWLMFNNFKLTYYSDAVSEEEATEILSQANALADADMQATVKTALTDAKNTFDGARTIANYNALSTAIDNANTSKNAYANAKAYLDEAETVLEGTNVYTTSAYNTYYATPKAAYDAKTLTNEEANALKPTSTGWHSANTIDDILLSAWTIGGEQCKDYDKALYINTWSTEGATDGSEFLAPFFEYWGADGESLGAKTLQATVTGLKASTTYSFTIRARVRQTDGKTKIANGITMKVGEGEAVDISAGAKFNNTQFFIGNFSAVGETDAEGRLTATITVAANSNVSWLSFYNAKYTEGEDLSAYIADYEFAKSTAIANRDNAAYSAITGKEKTDLVNAITTYNTVDETSKSDLIAAKEALETASNTFVTAAPAYTTFAELNTTVASTLGVVLPTITSSTTAADLDNEAYIVAEHTAAKAYAEDYTDKLGAWTNAPGTNSGESWDGSVKGDAKVDSYYDEYNKSARAMTQTVTLPAGDYALIAKGRASVNGRLTVVVGGQTVTFPHKGASGRGIATNGDATFGPEATYANSNNGRGWEYRVITFTSDGSAATTLTFNWTTASSNWCGLDDIELLCNPVALDYSALQSAYDAVEVPTLGFETGEYAPYVNADNLANIEAAKNMLDNKDASNQDEIDNLKNAITGMTWTANVGEVNAVYDGTFAAATNNGAPAGWTMSNNTLGGDYHSRAFVGDDRLSEFNGTKSAFFQRYDGTNSDRGSQYKYGNTTGYTMPLKAATTYRVTVDFTNWGTTDSKPLTLNVDGPSSFNASQTKNSTKDADKGADSPDQFDIIFTTTVAGNYVLRFQVQGSDDNKHNVVVSNIELKKATVSKTITAAGWATYCSPYALDLANATGLTDAYIVTGATGSVLNTTSVKGGTIPANTGILIEAPEGTVTIPVVAGSETNVDDNELVGVLENTEITAEAGYVLMGSPKVGFYQNEKAFTVGANTAYLPVTFAGSARAAYFFRGDITGVDNVEAAAEATLKDGKYLENGKIVIVKNGQKFNAAGAQMK